MAIVWLKRATGIGYKTYPPLHEVIDLEKAVEMEDKTRNLCQEIEYLDHLLTDNYLKGDGRKDVHL